MPAVVLSLLSGCNRAPEPASESAAPAGDTIAQAESEISAPAEDTADLPEPDIRAEEPPPPEPPAPEPPLRFSLPTENDGLFRDDLPSFYMFVDRYTADGGVVQKWEGGGYGMVRNPRDTPDGPVYTRFHEGIDIAPVSRDAKGEPTDEVRAIADGVVAYATSGPGLSNYGNYVVVGHSWGDAGTFYSLYAHLKKVHVDAGNEVKRGDPIGLMGYTGRGLDRRRAHVHLELCLLLNSRYDEFNAKHNKLANPHGNFNGANLAGLNVADFLRRNREDPLLMPDEFIRRQEVFFRVTVPNRGEELDLAQRYPWLRAFGEPSTSWEISFTETGIPVMVAPSDMPVKEPAVTWTAGPWKTRYTWRTRGLLRGNGPNPGLSTDGRRFIQLIAGDG